jgi:hypothetical protein
MGKEEEIVFSETITLIEPKMYMNNHGMVSYKINLIKIRSTIFYRFYFWSPRVKCIDLILIRLVTKFNLFVSIGILR